MLKNALMYYIKLNLNRHLQCIYNFCNIVIVIVIVK